MKTTALLWSFIPYALFLACLKPGIAESCSGVKHNPDHTGGVTIKTDPSPPIRHGTSLRIQCQHPGISHYPAMNDLILTRETERESIFLASGGKSDPSTCWLRTQSEEKSFTQSVVAVDVQKNVMTSRDAGKYKCCYQTECDSIVVGIDVVEIRIHPESQVNQGNPVIVECSSVYDFNNTDRETNKLKQSEMIVTTSNHQIIVSGCSIAPQFENSVQIDKCWNRPTRKKGIHFRIKKVFDSMEVCCQLGDATKQCRNIRVATPTNSMDNPYDTQKKQISNKEAEYKYTDNGTAIGVYLIVTIIIMIISNTVLAICR
ncbi:uncharacterized protein LOC141914014 [Tubulanus polymorphus]|uniref:uncharacterized protein LOC141914014 n=1 Tax=Tubulanus polymorphus TaxID=672921 RepID=UPI003DA2CFD4